MKNAGVEGMGVRSRVSGARITEVDNSYVNLVFMRGRTKALFKRL